MLTRSPSLWVKPEPAVSRSSVGANKVPRKSKEPIGILVIAIDRLGYQIQRVTTDLVHRTAAVEYVAVLPLDPQLHHAAAHIVDGEACIE